MSCEWVRNMEKPEAPMVLQSPVGRETPGENRICKTQEPPSRDPILRIQDLYSYY